MLQGLIGGTLIETPSTGVSRTGSPFVKAMVRSVDNARISHLINVVAFADRPRDALLALAEGDSVAVSGEMSIGTYQSHGETKVSIGLVAARVVTAYDTFE